MLEGVEGWAMPGADGVSSFFGLGFSTEGCCCPEDP